jgi:anti-sigma factor RsiW
MFMKTFEEKWTAWVDGKLSEAERAEFEASLDDPTSAQAEKNEALKLSTLLKEQLPRRAMGNEEFFHHQLRGRIEGETEEPGSRATSERRATWWTIPRLVWAGAASLAVFAVCTFFVMRETQTPGQSQYLTQILNARVDPGVNPYATVSIFQTKEDRVTVLWVDGLKSLPADYAAQ